MVVESENEIYLQIGGMTAEGKGNPFDTSSNYTGMKTLERYDGDTWESGFAKAQTYTLRTYRRFYA